MEQKNGYRLLIVEDDCLLAEGAADYFTAKDWEAKTAALGEQALELLEQKSFHLILLDVMMPGMNGFTLCRKIRETSDVPIIFITARVLEEDKLNGYSLGADDYVTKPFVISEVLARVRAVLRRSQASRQWEYNVSKSIYEPDITFRTLRIDRNDKLGFLNGEDMCLTRTEFDILLFFLTHRNRIYSREEIIQQVWDNDVVVTNRTIDTNIARLRKKIGEYGNNIVTRLGFGYGFKETI